MMYSSFCKYEQPQLKLKTIFSNSDFEKSNRTHFCRTLKIRFCLNLKLRLCQRTIISVVKSLNELIFYCRINLNLMEQGNGCEDVC